MEPDKHREFSAADLTERPCWDDYQKAYDAAIGHCSTGAAPWYFISANRKWYRTGP